MSIHDCEQPERMLRALLVLDALTYEQPDIMHDDAKTPLEHFVHDVYCIAHGASGTCGNPHKEWLDLIDERTRTLKESKIIDVDKVVEEVKAGKRDKVHDDSKDVFCTEKVCDESRKRFARILRDATKESGASSSIGRAANS